MRFNGVWHIMKHSVFLQKKHLLESRKYEKNTCKQSIVRVNKICLFVNNILWATFFSLPSTVFSEWYRKIGEQLMAEIFVNTVWHKTP